MDIYPDTIEAATWDFDVDVDPASATAEVWIAGAWHAASWVGAATLTAGIYTRALRLTLTGSNGVGITPTAADEFPLVRLNVGGEVIIRKSTNELTLEEVAA